MNTIDWLNWRVEAERVVAELIGVDIAYILLDLELPARYCTGFWGCVLPELADRLRTEIGSRWAGDGPALILNTTAIEASLPNWIEQRADAVDAVAWGVVCHEVAHILEFPNPTGGTLAAGLTREDFLRVTKVITPGAIPLPSPDEHDSQFCWTALHVRHRLAARGIEACLLAMIDNEAFGLPRPAWVMEVTIKSELRAMESLPLSGIARYPPPRPFIELFDPEPLQTISQETSAPAEQLPPVQKENHMLPFIDQLIKTKIDTTAEKGHEWIGLVIAVADGKELDKMQTLATLERLGKEPIDLQRAAEKVVHRKHLVSQITAADRARAGLPAINDEIVNANKLLEEAKDRHAETVRPLNGQIERINDASRLAGNAREELERTADPALLKALRDNSTELDTMRCRRLELSDSIGEVERKAKDLEVEAARCQQQHGSSEFEDRQLRGHNTRLTSMRDEMKLLNENIDRLQRFDDETRPKLLAVESI